MQVVATDIIIYIESQFRIGRTTSSGVTREKFVIAESSYSGVGRGSRSKFKALCHLLDVLQPLPKPTLWAIMLEARSSIEVALAKDSTSAFEWIEFEGKSVTPLEAILRVLRQTPDQHLQTLDTNLGYVSDATFRQQLLFDIAVASSALDNREWKASIVIAGSVVEALLIVALTDAGLAEGKLHSMSLEDLIANATRLMLIDKSLADQLNAVRNYRNLIHPGRAIREGESCTYGKAHVMIGVLHIIDEQLSSRSKK